VSNKPPVRSSSIQSTQEKRSRPSGRTVTRQRRVIAHAGKDDRGARLAWYVGGGIVVLVVILFGAGYYNDNIGPARNTAITVGGHDISLGYYRDRLRAATLTGGGATQRDAASKEATVTDNLEEEQVYLQKAGQLGVTVNDSEIALAIAKDVHATVSGDKISDPAQYEALVRSQLIRTKLSWDQERTLAKAAALKQKVLDHFKAAVPKQALSVKGIELTFTSEDQANQAVQRIAAGDTPTDVAADMTANPSLGTSKPIDWTPVPFGLLGGSIDRFAAEHDKGEISTILQVPASTPTGSPQYVIFQISDKDPSHDVTDGQATQIATKQQKDWFGQTKAALNVHDHVDGNNAIWAVTHVDLPVQAAASPTPPALPQRPGAAPSAPAGVPIGPQPAASAPAAPQAPAPPPPPAPTSNGSP
jgi:SurA-like N-terminal domain